MNLELLALWIDEPSEAPRSYKGDGWKACHHGSHRRGQAGCSQKSGKKYVSQIGAIVRDNVPISIREWKGKSTNPYTLPDTKRIGCGKMSRNISHFPKDIMKMM
jgi:hypothetical protein